MGGQTVMLHIGQAGLQIGSAFWELFNLEHGLAPDGFEVDPDNADEATRYSFDYFYYQTLSSGKYVPRIICVDTEPTVIDEMKAGPYRQLWSPKCMINDQEDASNNFARGYFNKGKIIVNDVLNGVRIQANLCDNLNSFNIVQSFSGGTGSGLSALLLERLTDLYGKKFKFGISVYPSPRFASSAVDPYNTMLHTHCTLEHMDCEIMVDNETLYSQCMTNLGVYSPTFTTINRMVAQMSTCIFQSHHYHYTGSRHADTSELLTNLVPYPRIHFPVLSYAPICSHASRDHESQTCESMTNSAFMMENQALDCRVVEQKYISCALLYRGLFTPREVNEAILKCKADKNIHFVEWCPTGFKVGVNMVAPVTVPGSEMAVGGRALSMLAGNISIKDSWVRVARQFELLYSKRAFVHWYVSEGMEEGEFGEAHENLMALERDYMEISADSDEIAAGEGEDISPPKRTSSKSNKPAAAPPPPPPPPQQKKESSKRISGSSEKNQSSSESAKKSENMIPSDIKFSDLEVKPSDRQEPPSITSQQSEKIKEMVRKASLLSQSLSQQKQSIGSAKYSHLSSQHSQNLIKQLSRLSASKSAQEEPQQSENEDNLEKDEDDNATTVSNNSNQMNANMSGIPWKRNKHRWFNSLQHISERITSELHEQNNDFFTTNNANAERSTNSKKSDRRQRRHRQQKRSAKVSETISDSLSTSNTCGKEDMEMLEQLNTSKLSKEEAFNFLRQVAKEKQFDLINSQWNKNAKINQNNQSNTSMDRFVSIRSIPLSQQIQLKNMPQNPPRLTTVPSGPTGAFGESRFVSNLHVPDLNMSNPTLHKFNLQDNQQMYTSSASLYIPQKMNDTGRENEQFPKNHNFISDKYVVINKNPKLLSFSEMEAIDCVVAKSPMGDVEDNRQSVHPSVSPINPQTSCTDSFYVEEEDDVLGDHNNNYISQSSNASYSVMSNWTPEVTIDQPLDDTTEDTTSDMLVSSVVSNDTITPIKEKKSSYKNKTLPRSTSIRKFKDVNVLHFKN